MTTNDLTALTYQVLLALERSEGVITPEIESMLDTIEGETPAKLDALRWVSDAARATGSWPRRRPALLFPTASRAGR